eukprot:357276-Chlamydomonas_euryale.AAC.1
MPWSKPLHPWAPGHLPWSKLLHPWAPGHLPWSISLHPWAPGHLPWSKPLHPRAPGHLPWSRRCTKQPTSIERILHKPHIEHLARHPRAFGAEGVVAVPHPTLILGRRAGPAAPANLFVAGELAGCTCMRYVESGMLCGITAWQPRRDAHATNQL